MIILSPNTTTQLSPLTQHQSWIMFVQAAPPCGGLGLIKIEGVRGEMIGHRLASISSENAYDTYVIGLLAVEDCQLAATQLHEQFANAHKHDGWFDPALDLLGFIQETSQHVLQELIAQTQPGGVPDGAVDIETIAQVLGVSVPTVRRLVAAKTIPGYKVGKRWRFIEYAPPLT